MALFCHVSTVKRECVKRGGYSAPPLGALYLVTGDQIQSWKGGGANIDSKEYDHVAEQAFLSSLHVR
jgi:hypothetical protein